MTSHQTRSLSLLEWPVFILSLSWAACKASLTALAVFRNRRAAGWPASKIFGLSFVQQLSLLPLEPRVALTSTTGNAIRAYCAKKNLPLRSTVLEDVAKPATLHEATLASAPPGAPVLLYFHGGGYAIPCNGAQLEASIMIARAAQCTRVFWLEYVLVPELRYPGQLIQAVAALRMLIETYNVKPEQIIIGGDSAGAHLALGVVAHQMQPCPEVGPSLKLSSNIKGLVLFSPWLALSTSSASFKENASRDHISVAQMNEFIGLWRPKPDEVWADMLVSPAGFWNRSKIPVDRIAIVVGMWESFRDDILEFASRASVEAHGKTDCLIKEKTGIHVDIVFDITLDLPMAKSTNELLTWLKDI